MALTNIKSISLYNAKEEYINMFTPSDPTINTAYFIPSANSWDGLATISVADDVFDTDNTDFRSQLGKIQYAPRIFTIQGIIVVLNPSDNATEEDLYAARSELLRKLQKLFSEKDGGLQLAFSHDMNPITFYTLYCHLHGADAFRVFKHPKHYEVSISLIAEDPLIYQEPIVKTITSEEDFVDNKGDVEEYAKIELLKCVEVSYYACMLSDYTFKTVYFREPVTGNVTINVSYPHQICSISGATTIDNIDISEGKSAFLKIPRGISKWGVDTEATIKITYRQPLLGIAP